MLKPIPLDDARWIAGIIDSEGSFNMTKNRSSRVCRCRICTTDDVIVPHICDLVGKRSRCRGASGMAKSNGLEIRFVGTECRQLLDAVFAHLYLKRPHAECVRTALNIKSGKSSPYTETENKLWTSCKSELNKLNAKGPQRLQYIGPTDHEFGWQWLAGLIDGDGSIHPAKFRRGKSIAVKPCLSITLSNHSTIDYIAGNIGLPAYENKSRGNRSDCKKLRILTTALMRILPKLIPHLRLKRDLAVAALHISELKSRTRGENSGPLIEEIQKELDQFVRLCGHRSLEEYRSA
jgi:hypothetical protein